jgi:hypothetical protein
MAEERNVESFTLGIIVVLLAYFLLEKKFGARNRVATSNSKSSGGCGCGGNNAAVAANSGAPPDQVIALGQSFAEDIALIPGQVTSYFAHQQNT